MRVTLVCSMICMSIALLVQADPKTVTEFRTVTTTLYANDLPETVVSPGKTRVTERPSHANTGTPGTANTPANTPGTPVTVVTPGTPATPGTVQTPGTVFTPGTFGNAKGTTKQTNDATPGIAFSMNTPAVKSAASGSASGSAPAAGFTFSPITLAPESSHAHPSSLHELTARVSGRTMSGDASAGNTLTPFAYSFVTMTGVAMVAALANTLV